MSKSDMQKLQKDLSKRMQSPMYRVGKVVRARSNLKQTIRDAIADTQDDAVNAIGTRDKSRRENRKWR